MSDFRIAVLDDWQHIALAAADWSPVQKQAEVVVFDRHLDEDEAAVQLRDFDALCMMRERMAMPRRMLERLPRLKLICITGAKHRTLDEDAVRERGIAVLAAAGAETGASSTSELAWGLILAWMRRIPQEAQGMREGGWQTQCGSALRGKTLGLVGLGKLGKQMVPVAHAFGMQVRAWSSNLTPEAAASAGAQYTAKEDLFIISDIVSLHLVLGERSCGIVTRADLGRMRPQALLVNTARAGLVDQEALYEALVQRRIGGAALDVFDEEPLPAHDRLRTLDNVLLTPHLGYAVQEQMRAYQQNTVRNIVEYLRVAR